MIIPPNIDIVRQIADAGNDEATSNSIQAASWRIAGLFLCGVLATALIGAAIIYVVVQSA
jgi:hypothetical protein